jgi:hypothetical protein
MQTRTVGVFAVLRNCILASLSVCGMLACAQTSTSENLLCEGSFEHTDLNLMCWQVDVAYGGSVNEAGGADGTTWIKLVPGGSIWQTFATQPGEEYAIRFAFAGADSPLRVSLDAQVVGVAETNISGWSWKTFTGLASSNSATVRFTALSNFVALDGVSAIWTREPPRIISQPRSASTYVGGTVSFNVEVKGAPPLTFQWWHDGQPINFATSKAFTISSAATGDAGEYSVFVSNAFGAVTSSIARLNVESVTTPVIVLQPYGGIVATGAYHILTVAAVGEVPLQYQWFKNEVSLSGATNRQFEFTTIQTNDAGSYAVRVVNQLGSVNSLPANLQVSTTNQGGGLVRFETTNPIYDVDGITPLSGTNFLAQLYAGPSLDALVRAGSPTPFRNSVTLPGTVVPKTVTVPNVAPFATVYVQVRAWDRARGSTYEEARALGGKFGRSNIATLIAGGGSPPAVPPRLTNMQSFNLAAGLPLFNVGTIELVERRPQNAFVWSLMGEMGFRYSIERSLQRDEWHPLLILTNITGTTTFVDPDTPPPGVVLYRGRILD